MLKTNTHFTFTTLTPILIYYLYNKCWCRKSLIYEKLNQNLSICGLLVQRSITRGVSEAARHPGRPAELWARGPGTTRHQRQTEPRQPAHTAPCSGLHWQVRTLQLWATFIKVSHRDSHSSALGLWSRRAWVWQSCQADSLDPAIRYVTQLIERPSRKIHIFAVRAG